MCDVSKINELLEEAWNQRRVGNYEKARELVERAKERTKDDDYNSLGRIFHVYAQFHSDKNDLPKALEMYEQSLEFYRKADNRDKIAHSTRHIADNQRELGQDENSERNYRLAVGIYKSNTRTFAGDLANALRGFAIVLESRNKIPEAIAAWEETKDLYRECDLQMGQDEAQRKSYHLGATERH